ncbi:MAG: 5'/3'-nucleotidase SurE [Desulfocapsaceae bacterium]
MKDVHIALTNDDGIESPGLRAAVAAVADLGRITIVAPTDQQTATGRGLTGNKQSKLERVSYPGGKFDVEAYHCPCSPAQVVRHAMFTLFRFDKPDLLISGINYGENLGNMISCSGTVGAALEASSHGVAALAVSKQTDIASHHNYTSQDWQAAAHFLRKFTQLVLDMDLPADVDLLKIDVPDGASEETGWKMTRLSRSSYYSKILDNTSIDTRVGDFKTRIRLAKEEVESDSDIFALAVEKQVAVTPLSLDFTSRVDLGSLRDSFLP